MAIYEYRCDHDGVFEVIRRLGTAPQTVPCSTCGRGATRVISLPRIRSTSRAGVFAAIERAERSRHEPEVVTSPPAAGAYRRTRMATLTPERARLPRP
jgi:putative FmdB family regulatory protein